MAVPTVLVNVIAIIAIVLAVGVAVFIIVRKKKSGAACMSCPYGGQCSGGCDCDAKIDKNK